MGGTFNPIHTGHLLLAEWAREEVGLEEVWFVPTGISYRKDSRETLPAAQRLYMTRLAVRDNAAFKCLDIEVRREGYTYSYETLAQLRAGYTENEYFFITGADCLFTIETWKKPERLLEDCTLVAAVRGETRLEALEEKRRELEQRYPCCQGKILLLPFLKMSVSSTDIRQRLRQGKSVRYLVPDAVLAYIEEKGLYREDESL